MKRVLSVLAAVGLAILPGSSARAASLGKPQPVVTGLEFASNIAFAPDGRIFIAEKDTGDIQIFDGGRLLPQPFARIDVLSSAEQGLLGIALDPGFPQQPWVYAYYSDPSSKTNELVRLRADGNTAVGQPQPLLSALTTENAYHNGGDIAFGADGKLYLSVGEVHEADRAQDPSDLGGKILRLNPDGSIPPDNPFGPGNPAYSIGHRNSFGLCVDPSNGDLWETENGPDSYDEVNLIEAGANYGWPDQLGPGGEPKFTDPVVAFEHVIVPTGCAVWNGGLYFGSYIYGDVHRLQLPLGSGAAQDESLFRLPEAITDLQTGPDGGLYVVTTSTIYRFGVSALGGGSANDSPTSSSVAPTGASAQKPPPVAGPDEARGNGAPLLAIAAAVALALGLTLRIAAGRRLKREAGEDRT